MRTDNNGVKTKDIKKRLSAFRYVLILEGMGVGILAGVVIVLFRLAIMQAESIMAWIRGWAATTPAGVPVYILLLAVALSGVAFLLIKVPLISGSGIPQVKGELRGELKQPWAQVLGAKFLGGVLAIGAGLSLGREGPSVQLGAMMGKGVAAMGHRARTEERLLMTCGAGAGLAAAFNAPFAGVVFALEELHKNYSPEVILSTMAAAITSDSVCRYVFGLDPVFTFPAVEMLPLKYYWLVLLLGIFLGAMGVLYNTCIRLSQDAYKKVPGTLLRLTVPFACAGILGFLYPDVLGGGSSLVEKAGSGSLLLSALAICFFIKFLFSMVSFGSGSPGGIFLPLLVLGSLLGALFFHGSAAVLPIEALYLQNFVILGMAGYFSAIVRSPMTGIVLICEMTGSFSQLLTLSIVSLAAYITADLLKGRPIYDQLLERLLAARRKWLPSEGLRTRTFLEVAVSLGSSADGMNISEMQLPKGALIVSLTRGEEELVPNGSTTLLGGDHILLLCYENDLAGLHEQLDDLCRRIAKD